MFCRQRGPVGKEAWRLEIVWQVLESMVGCGIMEVPGKKSLGHQAGTCPPPGVGFLGTCDGDSLCRGNRTGRPPRLPTLSASNKGYRASTTGSRSCSWLLPC